MGIMRDGKARILGIATALVIALAPATPALAADTIDGNGVGAAGTSVTFNDTFKAAASSHAYNLPAATFHYTITPGSGAAATASTPKIEEGVTGATITDAEHLTTVAGDVEDTVDVTVDFGGVTFDHAGIYRYQLTEELGASSVAADITCDTGDTGDTGVAGTGSYVLDVYVRKANGAFAPAAYVLSKAGEITRYTNDTTPQAVTYANKVDTITNEYTTYDLTVSNTILGDMAANDFDFAIGLSLPGGVIVRQDEGTAGLTGASAEATATLRDGESTTIYGLPSTATYAVDEGVNQLEGYKVEVTDNNANSGTYGWKDQTGSATRFGSSAPATMGEADAGTVVAFTNSLSSISPTGIVMRYAPFVAILGIGLVLLRLSRKEDAGRD